MGEVESKPGIERRTVLGAVWAAPAIAVAMAVPATAASPATGVVVFVLRSAYQAGSSRASAAVVQMNAYEAANPSTPVPGLAVTVTFLPSGIVAPAVTDSQGFFSVIQDTGPRQVSYQVASADGSTTGIQNF